MYKDNGRMGPMSWFEPQNSFLNTMLNNSLFIAYFQWLSPLLTIRGFCDADLIAVCRVFILGKYTTRLYGNDCVKCENSRQSIRKAILKCELLLESH